MKKFLSGIAHGFEKVVGVLGRINPYLGLLANFLPDPQPGQPASAVQKIKGGLTEAMQIIAESEAAGTILLGPGNGPAKLKLAAPQIGILIEDALSTLGLEIEDEAAATTAITGITSNLADLLNACKRK